MNQHSRQEVSGPNPALEPFRLLIGRWSTTGTHGQNPYTILQGHTSFEWLENGAFLRMHSEIDDPRFPSTIAIIGSDVAQDGEYGCSSNVALFAIDEGIRWPIPCCARTHGISAHYGLILLRVQ